MKKNGCLSCLLWSALGLFLLQMVSCNDFVEKDLTKKSVTLLFPSKDAVVSSQPVSFTWDSLAYAKKYTFQIVSVSATGGMSLVADSVTGVRFIQKTLSTGKYIWRVSGQNDVSATPFTESAFTVTSTVQAGVQKKPDWLGPKETEEK